MGRIIDSVRARWHLVSDERETKMTYGDYIQSNAWRTNPARLREFEAAGFACRLCPAAASDGATLESHHRTYDRLGNEIDAFLDCILNGGKPLVDGRAGCEALRVASMINESIDEHLKKVQNQPGRPAGAAAGS